MLKGDNVHLRAVEPSDVDFLYNCENNPENWRISHTLAPFTRDSIERYVSIEQDVFLYRQVRFIICINTGEPIGTIDLFEYDPIHLRAGVGILIAEENDRNKGYATESLELIIRYAFDHLMLETLFCNILEDNYVSLRLFEKRGFEVSGLKKNWIKTKDGMKNEFILQLLNNGIS